VATPNYGYEKRQKELAKKRKKEEKLKNRAERSDVDEEAGATPTSETTTLPNAESEPN
jgi:hypothetical protein